MKNPSVTGRARRLDQMPSEPHVKIRRAPRAGTHSHFHVRANTAGDTSCARNQKPIKTPASGRSRKRESIPRALSKRCFQITPRRTSPRFCRRHRPDWKRERRAHNSRPETRDASRKNWPQPDRTTATMICKERSVSATCAKRSPTQRRPCRDDGGARSFEKEAPQS